MKNKNYKQLVRLIKQKLKANGGVYTDEINKLIDLDIESNPGKYDDFDRVSEYELNYVEVLESMFFDPISYLIQPGDYFIYSLKKVSFDNLFLYAKYEETDGYDTLRHWFYKHIQTQELYEIAAFYDVYDDFEISMLKRIKLSDSELIKLGCQLDILGYNKRSRRYRISNLI